jgi:N-dimethylarginine dimethylaminohydrolase
MPTYLMSYPGPSWHIRGGQNARSQSRSPTNPRQALREWIALCDAITRAGGRILVMSPPSVDPPLTGMPYTSSLGHLFGVDEARVFVLANMAAAHRQAEREFARAFLADAGLRTTVAAHPWEGQAELQVAGGNRYIATWGVRSERASLDEIRPLLPSGSHLLDVQLRAPFVHGDQCLASLVTRGGAQVVLAHPAATVNMAPEALRRYLGNSVEVYPVDADDAAALACSSMSVNGTLIVPSGLSTTLRGNLVRRGFTVEELHMPELAGKGGGGPRSLTNELRGMVVNPGAPDYLTLRDELMARADAYPESVAPPPAATPAS